VCVVNQLRKLYLTEDKRKQAAEDEVAILAAAARQDEFSEAAHLDSYIDEEHGTAASSGTSVSIAGRRFSFDGLPRFPSSSPQRTPAVHTHPAEPNSVYEWGMGLIENVKRRISAVSIDSDAGQIRVHRNDSVAEMEVVLRAPVLKQIMHHLMSSLDSIVSTPFVYLAKGSDPISLQLAVDYIAANELTKNIIVVHFVDDRKSVNMHHKIMRRVSDLVQGGGIEQSEADKYAERLLKRSFTGLAGGSSHEALSQHDNEELLPPIPSSPGSAHNNSSDDNNNDDEFNNQEPMFEFDDSVTLLSENVQQLIKTVALLDTFHA
jgi:hypothetical protein